METLSAEPKARLERARKSLDGLALGDAFGQQVLKAFRQRETLAAPIEDRFLAAAIDKRMEIKPWPWTDDTALALEVVAALAAKGTIDPDDFAPRLAIRYQVDPKRGFGRAMHELLPRLAQGRGAWKSAPRELFDGVGSFGNGAAMRVAPLGAYFADDLERVPREAEASALVTHAHPEGVAGAVAVALAAAHAARRTKDWLALVRDALAPGLVRDGIARAADLEGTTPIEDAARALGNGFEVSAQDTVPFCLWIAHHQGPKLSHALASAAQAGGDVDTNCAIVGGIIASYAPFDGVAVSWRSRREPLA